MTLSWHACAALALAALFAWHRSLHGTALALQCGAFAALVASAFVTAGRIDDASVTSQSPVRLVGTIYLGLVLMVLWQVARQLAKR